MATKNNNSAGQVEALLNARNVVIVGASDRPGSWSPRSWRNLQRFNYPGKVFPMNPSRETIWDTRCYATFDELPEKPDHLLVMVPARFVCQTLRDGKAAGARSATVITAGFSEASDAGSRARAEELAATIAETGLAVSGPNCLGNFNGVARFVTMPDDRPQRCEAGPIAIVGQSGGLVMALKRTLEERGMDTGFAITSGNEAGLTTADYIHYFAQEPHTRLIICYLESVRDPANFLAACRAAKRAGKPVLVVKLGSSDEGRAAAMAHTGALAGSVAAFDTIAGGAGVIRVKTLDDMIETAEYFLHVPLPKGPRVGAITVSGGLRGMMLDAADENGIEFPALSARTDKALRELLGVGTIIGNPLDSGFAALTSKEVYVRCIEIMLADPRIDTLLVQEELTRAPGTERKEINLRAVNEVAGQAKKPIAFVTMLSHSLTDHSRALRATLPHLAFLQEPDKALRAVGKIADYVASLKVKRGSVRLPEPPLALKRVLARAARGDGPTSLSEFDSKSLLRAYGLKMPKERLVTSAGDAVKAAKHIGYPVVLKAVGAALTHKTEIGGVLLDNRTATDVRNGFAALRQAVERTGAAMDGVLVAEQVSGGVELVIGVSCDPEMGPFIMMGSGGIALELYRDVAFAAPVFDEAGAKALIARTKAARLIDGFRGSDPLDVAALVKALIAVSRLAVDLGGALDSIDINPFSLRRRGGVALDALVVLSGKA
jgi:acyl-CoA synthetase (NDP forming)